VIEFGISLFSTPFAPLSWNLTVFSPTLEFLSVAISFSFFVVSVLLPFSGSPSTLSGRLYEPIPKTTTLPLLFTLSCSNFFGVGTEVPDLFRFSPGDTWDSGLLFPWLAPNFQVPGI